MFKLREFSSILIVAIIFALVISLLKSIESFLWALLIAFVVIIINVLAKKIIAIYYGSDIETKIWEVQRFGWHPRTNLKKPFPMGLAMPIIVAVLSVGYIWWMACLAFEVKPKAFRTSKTHGIYSFSELTENHLGKIAAAGVFVNLFFAVVGYLIGYSDFARINVYFAFFNMIPFSDLDGNKIFFGSIVLWSFLAIVTLIGLGYALLLV